MLSLDFYSSLIIPINPGTNMASDITLWCLLTLALKENIVQLLPASLKKGEITKITHTQTHRDYTHTNTHSHTCAQTYLHTHKGFCLSISDL